MTNNPNANKCGDQTPGATICDTGSAPCNQSITIEQLAVTGGSCIQSAQTPTVDPIGWGKAGNACGGESMNGTGCNANYLCVPKPPSPFLSGMCVHKPGVNSCPPVPGSPFTAQHTFYTSALDTRGCSDCSCGAPSGATCSATVTWYPTTNCTGTPVGTVNVSSQNAGCVNLINNPDVGSRKATISGPTAGTCAKSGGQPTGTAVPNPATATTFCCIP